MYYNFTLCGNKYLETVKKINKIRKETLINILKNLKNFNWKMF